MQVTSVYVCVFFLTFISVSLFSFLVYLQVSKAELFTVVVNNNNIMSISVLQTRCNSRLVPQMLLRGTVL